MTSLLKYDTNFVQDWEPPLCLLGVSRANKSHYRLDNNALLHPTALNTKTTSCPLPAQNYLTTLLWGFSSDSYHNAAIMLSKGKVRDRRRWSLFEMCDIDVSKYYQTLSIKREWNYQTKSSQLTEKLTSVNLK